MKMWSKILKINSVGRCLVVIVSVTKDKKGTILNDRSISD